MSVKSVKKGKESSSSKTSILSLVLERWKKANPHPKCELFFHTPYQLLVSVVLSAQATDKIVNRCMTPVYNKGFTPEVMLELGEKGFLDLIRAIGLAPTKAKNVYRLTTILVEKFGGHIPETREDLESLPGVGRKTANVILGEIFGKPTLAVDTHVFRVANRLGFHHENTPLKAEEVLLKLIPEQYLPAAHHWFILHGRYICKAKKPLCSTCLLEDLCPKIGL